MDSSNKTDTFVGFAAFLNEVKGQIRSAQARANFSMNREVIGLYWRNGQMRTERQNAEGWEAKVLDRLALDLKNELSPIKGFSARNMKRMKAFYIEYPDMPKTVSEPQPADNAQEIKVPQGAAQIGASATNVTEKVPQLEAQLATAGLGFVKSSLPEIDELEDEPAGEIEQDEDA